MNKQELIDALGNQYCKYCSSRIGINRNCYLNPDTCLYRSEMGEKFYNFAKSLGLGVVGEIVEPKNEYKDVDGGSGWAFGFYKGVEATKSLNKAWKALE